MINHKHNFIFIEVHKTGSSTIQSILENVLDVKNRIKHVPLDYYSNKFPTKFNNYFKFMFVRNPWSRVISLYKREIKENDYSGGLESFINRIKFATSFCQVTGQAQMGLPRNKLEKLNQIDYGRINDSDKIHMDFIGKTENLENDLRFIFKKINLDWSENIWGKYKNSNRGSYKKHYTEYYNNKTNKMIGEKFAKDIEYFGYQFGA